MWDAILLSFFLVLMITEIVLYKQLIEYGLNFTFFFPFVGELWMNLDGDISPICLNILPLASSSLQ